MTRTARILVSLSIAAALLSAAAAHAAEWPKIPGQGTDWVNSLNEPQWPSFADAGRAPLSVAVRVRSRRALLVLDRHDQVRLQQRRCRLWQPDLDARLEQDARACGRNLRAHRPPAEQPVRQGRRRRRNPARRRIHRSRLSHVSDSVLGYDERRPRRQSAIRHHRFRLFVRAAALWRAVRRLRRLSLLARKDDGLRSGLQCDDLWARAFHAIRPVRCSCPYNVPVLVYEPTWHALRIGGDARIRINQHWSVSGEAALVLGWLDNKDSHLLRQDMPPGRSVRSRTGSQYPDQGMWIRRHGRDLRQLRSDAESGSGTGPSLLGHQCRPGPYRLSVRPSIKTFQLDYFDQSRWGLLAQVKGKF